MRIDVAHSLELPGREPSNRLWSDDLKDSSPEAILGGRYRGATRLNLLGSL
jgi:hypothetical protein